MELVAKMQKEAAGLSEVSMFQLCSLCLLKVQSQLDVACIEKQINQKQLK